MVRNAAKVAVLGACRYLVGLRHRWWVSGRPKPPIKLVGVSVQDG